MTLARERSIAIGSNVRALWADSLELSYASIAVLFVDSVDARLAPRSMIRGQSPIEDASRDLFATYNAFVGSSDYCFGSRRYSDATDSAAWLTARLEHITPSPQGLAKRLVAIARELVDDGPYDTTTLETLHENAYGPRVPSQRRTNADLYHEPWREWFYEIISSTQASGIETMALRAGVLANRLERCVGADGDVVRDASLRAHDIVARCEPPRSSLDERRAFWQPSKLSFTVCNE